MTLLASATAPPMSPGEGGRRRSSLGCDAELTRAFMAPWSTQPTSTGGQRAVVGSLRPPAGLDYDSALSEGTLSGGTLSMSAVTLGSASGGPASLSAAGTTTDSAYSGAGAASLAGRSGAGRSGGGRRSCDASRRCSVGAAVPSARVFYAPQQKHPLQLVHGFLDAFKGVEAAYLRLLCATDADTAGVEWSHVCFCLVDLDRYMLDHASTEGPFFMGAEPSLAEAATAPALFRMVECLPALRDLGLIRACEEMGLGRLVEWLDEVLSRPEEVCDVVALPPHVYVTHARKLHVRYEGPPSPCSFRGPRSASEVELSFTAADCA